MATSQPFKDFVVRFRKGDRIFSTGDPGTEMYIVQSGSVEIFKEGEDGRVSLAVMEKGDFFGDMALIASEPHANCAVALEECELVEINSTLFDKMIKGNIEIAVRMLRKLSMRLRDATRKLEEQRIASASAAVAPPPAMQVAAVAAPQIAPLQTVVPETVIPATAPPQPSRGGESSGTRVATGPRPSGCHAVLLSEDGREMFHIISTRAVIGRFDPVTGLKPEVDLSNLDLNRSVSRHHARLTLEGGVYNVIEEVGALNGTFINGKKLVSGKASRIRSGDTLNLGMVRLLFQEIGD